MKKNPHLKLKLPSTISSSEGQETGSFLEEQRKDTPTYKNTQIPVTYQNRFDATLRALHEKGKGYFK